MENEMTVADKSRIRYARSQKIVKSNDIIQKTRTDFTVQQQKIILYMVSLIKPEDTEFKEIEIDLKDLCRICGIEPNPKNYRNFRESIKSIRDKSFFVMTPKGETAVSWIEKFYIQLGNRKVIVRLDDDMKTYLLQLKKNFTEYTLEYVLCFKSGYSIQLYELLKSVSYTKHLKMSIDEIKAFFMLSDVYQSKDITQKIIKPSLKEINKFTDISVNVISERSMRRLSGYSFTIELKDHTAAAAAIQSRQAAIKT